MSINFKSVFAVVAAGTLATARAAFINGLSTEERARRLATAVEYLSKLNKGEAVTPLKELSFEKRAAVYVQRNAVARTGLWGFNLYWLVGFF